MPVILRPRTPKEELEKKACKANCLCCTARKVPGRQKRKSIVVKQEPLEESYEPTSSRKTPVKQKKKSIIVKQEPRDEFYESISLTQSGLLLTPPPSPPAISSRSIKITYGKDSKRVTVKHRKILIPTKKYKMKKADETPAPEVPQEYDTTQQIVEPQVGVSEFPKIELDQPKNIMTRRILNSDAYINYLANLRIGQRSISNWQKGLGSAILKKSPAKRGRPRIHFIKKKSTGENVVSENVITQTLWKMRDQFLSTCLGMHIPAKDYSIYTSSNAPVENKLFVYNDLAIL